MPARHRLTRGAHAVLAVSAAEAALGRGGVAALRHCGGALPMGGAGLEADVQEVVPRAVLAHGLARGAGVAPVTRQKAVLA